jgi:hypothetical protein
MLLQMPEGRESMYKSFAGGIGRESPYLFLGLYVTSTPRANAARNYA